MANSVKKVTVEFEVDAAGIRKARAKIDSDFREIEKAAGLAESKINSFGSTLKKIGAIAATGIVVKQIGDLAVRAFELSKQFEQTRVSFETFLGSAKKADAILRQLDKFSQATPFDPTQVNQAAKSLLAFGRTQKQIIPDLKKIGDISAATGKDFNELTTIFGKARTQGVLFAEDINQLTEAGIPVIQEFAKQLGVSEGQVKKLASQGKISFKNLEQAFGDLTGEGGRFFNLMEKQSQTVAGRISTLKGTFDNLLRSLADRFSPEISSLVDGFQDMAESALKFVEVPLSEKLEEERVGLNVLVQQITEANTSQEDRLKLINQLNNEYPDFLGNLKAETVSNEQLTKRLKEVNEQMINRIIIQRKQEEIDEQLADAADAREDIIEREADLRERLIELQDEFGIKLLEEATLLERLQDARKQLNILAKDGAAGVAFNAELRAAIELRNEIRELGEEKAILNKENNILNDLTEKRNKLAKELNVDLGNETDAVEENTEAVKKNAAAKKKALTEKQLADLLAPIDEIDEGFDEEFAAQLALEERDSFEEAMKVLLADGTMNLEDEMQRRQDALTRYLEAQREIQMIERDLNQQSVASAEELFLNLTTIFGNTEAAQKAAFLFSQAAAVNDVFINLQKQVSAIRVATATQAAAQAAFNPAALVQGQAQATTLITRARIAAAGSIAAITARTFQQFAEGTDEVKGGVQGKDSVAALLMPGEAVVQTKMNNKYKKAVQAIRRDNLDEYMLKDYIPEKAKQGLIDESILQNLALNGQFDDRYIVKGLSRNNKQSVINTNQIVNAIRSNRGYYDKRYN